MVKEVVLFGWTMFSVLVESIVLGNVTIRYGEYIQVIVTTKEMLGLCV